MEFLRIYLELFFSDSLRANPKLLRKASVLRSSAGGSPLIPSPGSTSEPSFFSSAASISVAQREAAIKVATHHNVLDVIAIVERLSIKPEWQSNPRYHYQKSRREYVDRMNKSRDGPTEPPAGQDNTTSSSPNNPGSGHDGSKPTKPTSAPAAVPARFSLSNPATASSTPTPGRRPRWGLQDEIRVGQNAQSTRHQLPELDQHIVDLISAASNLDEHAQMPVECSPWF